MFDETTSQQRDEPSEIEGPRSSPKSWSKTKWIAVILLGLGIVAAGIVFFVTRPGSKDASNSLGKTRAAQSVGNEVRLYIKGRDTIMVAADEKTLDEMIAAMSARTDALQELIQSGRVLTVPTGTRARIVDRGFGKTKVRIIEGDKILSEGWVPESWVW